MPITINSQKMQDANGRILRQNKSYTHSFWLHLTWRSILLILI